MFKPFFNSLAYATSFLSFSIFPSFASPTKDFSVFTHHPKTMTVALASSTLTEFQKKHLTYDLFQFQVEFLLSPKCPGTVGLEPIFRTSL